MLHPRQPRSLDIGQQVINLFLLGLLGVLPIFCFAYVCQSLQASISQQHRNLCISDLGKVFRLPL